MTQTLEIFGGEEDVTSDISVELIQDKINERFQFCPIVNRYNLKNLIRGHMIKTMTSDGKGISNSIGLNLFTDANEDGTFYVFRKGLDANATDPRLTSAIANFFEIICTCFTPNGPAEKKHSAEMHAMLSVTINDLSTTGNMSAASIDTQVHFYNTVLYNLFHIHKTAPFKDLKAADPAFNQIYLDEVSKVLLYTSDAIVLKTSTAVLFPTKVPKQFGSKVDKVAAQKSAAEKRKDTKAANQAAKKAKTNQPAPVVNSPVVQPIVNNNASPKGVSSIHCVNAAAVLMTSQWPASAPPPPGCLPTRGPCTRQHTMNITAGTPIDKALVADLMTGVNAFNTNKGTVFQKNFIHTLKNWK